MSLSFIEKKTGISKGQISKKSKFEAWEKETKKKQLIADAVSVAVEKETLKETALDVHNEIVDEKTKHLIFFNKSALRNQQLANKKLSEQMKIQDLEAHSRLTAKNKETVIGKSPDVAIQNNQNTLPQININVES